MGIEDHYLVKEGYIPWNKGEAIRGIILGMRDKNPLAMDYIAKQIKRSEDEEAALKCSHGYFLDESQLYVGKSATLLRCARYLIWDKGQEIEFVMDNQLRKRQVCDNPEIIHWSLGRLRDINGEVTTQWITAALLTGRDNTLKEIPDKVQMTLDVIAAWEANEWRPRHDETLFGQAVAYLELLHKGKTTWQPQHTEDYCVGKGLGRVTLEQEAEWKECLDNQESIRTQEASEVLAAADAGQPIYSKDHRPLQEVAFYQKLKNPDITWDELNIIHPEAISKSWPLEQFKRFLEDSPRLNPKLFR